MCHNYPERVWGRMKLVRPERFELPTAWFVARYSIQLSYGRAILIRMAPLCQKTGEKQGEFSI
jgi:hypothetical protein